MDSEIIVPDEWKYLFFRLFAPQNAGTSASSLCQDKFGSVEHVQVLGSRTVVVGGNRVGKSTYNRWLINMLLDNHPLLPSKPLSGSRKGIEKPYVVYIDLDPGQPEFTPPGMISVLKIDKQVYGPNHAHLRRPLLSKFLGTLNVSDISSLYMRCAKELINFVLQSEELRNAPIVVNTMGFCRGIGIKITCQLLCLMDPSVVIQIHYESGRLDDRRSFPFMLDPVGIHSYLKAEGVWWGHVLGSINISPSYQFFRLDSLFMKELEPERIRIWTAKAKSLRNDLLSAYFSNTATERQPIDVWALPSNVALLSNLIIATMDSSLSYDGILRAMETNLVALCRIEYESTQETDPVTGESTYHLPKLISQAAQHVNTLYGYGIVKRIDRESKLIFIVTPLSQKELQDNVNAVVVAGKVGLPAEFYLNSDVHRFSLNETTFFPYLLPKDVSNTRLNEAATRKKVDKRQMPKVLKQSLQ